MTDRFTAPDYYWIDELLTEEQKLVRNSVREWVKKKYHPL
jgi:glutaryl-CoA dehydrogenase